MSLFRCEECNVIENTATSRYWQRNHRKDWVDYPLNGRALCSLCDPAIARWHDIFERVQYDPAKHEVKNPAEEHV